MPEPLKAIYTETFLRNFAKKVHDAYSPFDIERFISNVMDDTWDDLKLKSRMRRIAVTLGKYLPKSYEEALNILFAIDESCTGFPYLFFPDFIEVFGLAAEHWELSMKALERFTMRSSSEFAVRPFLLNNPERMMCQMETWAKHPSEHVRRLASEGCRPRLPWSVALPVFKHDPTRVLSVLELLKKDSSLYVRKSVANNLNDISKDNPSIVIKKAYSWKGENAHTDWIMRRGCRTLIRKGNPEIMALFGYAPVKDEELLTTCASLIVTPNVLSIGERCELRYELCMRECKEMKIRIEYRIDFIKAGGKKSGKTFFLSDKTVLGGSCITGIRTHSWADLSTRRHYPGEHVITLLINGQGVACNVVKLSIFLI